MIVSEVMDWLPLALNVLHHLPEYIALWSAALGPWVYVLLFSIIFSETGFIFTPFLPGDSLLFAAGALTALNGPLSLPTLATTLIAAAILGDFLNFSVGRMLGRVLLRKQVSRLVNKSYLERAQLFYHRHGAKAVILARFLPIIRTYAPFVAGVSQISQRRYIGYNVIGAALWVSLFLVAGHLFGNLPFVKERFQYVILAIIFISLAPAVIEFIRASRKKSLQQL
jgi:membrane-associated protein